MKKYISLLPMLFLTVMLAHAQGNTPPPKKAATKVVKSAPIEYTLCGEIVTGGKQVTYQYATTGSSTRVMVFLDGKLVSGCDFPLKAKPKPSPVDALFSL